MSNSPTSITSAIDLFPDLFQQHRALHLVASRETTEKRESAAPLLRQALKDKGLGRQSKVAVPQPPDTSWLPTGIVQQGLQEDTELRHGLLLISDQTRREKVARVVAGFGYLLHLPDKPADAIALVQGTRPSVVIADASDAFPEFHAYLTSLAMSSRRLIYYGLIGPRYKTLYHLEALASSVNLVIGYSELDFLDKILRLGFQEYRRLFLPLIETMNQRYPLLS